MFGTKPRHYIECQSCEPLPCQYLNKPENSKFPEAARKPGAYRGRTGNRTLAQTLESRAVDGGTCQRLRTPFARPTGSGNWNLKREQQHLARCVDSSGRRASDPHRSQPRKAQAGMRLTRVSGAPKSKQVEFNPARFSDCVLSESSHWETRLFRAGYFLNRPWWDCR